LGTSFGASTFSATFSTLILVGLKAVSSKVFQISSSDGGPMETVVEVLGRGRPET
jgi:hypothetical protein